MDRVELINSYNHSNGIGVQFPIAPASQEQVKVRLQTAPDGTYTGGMDVARKTFAKDGISG